MSSETTVFIETDRRGNNKGTIWSSVKDDLVERP